MIPADESADVIDALVGVTPGSRLDRIRAHRPQARSNAQASYRALFAPAVPGSVSLAERFAVAGFVAALHRRPEITAFYRTRLAALAGEGLAEVIDRAAETGAAEGPYGSYPAGPLSVEDRDGSRFRVPDRDRTTLGPRLAAALNHAHLLVFHPRDASPEALQALLDAGLSTTDIVTHSQIVSFLAFQIRVVEGLRVLAATFAGVAA